MKAKVHLTVEGTIEIEKELESLWAVCVTKEYGKKLKECRLRKGLTLVQLSQMSGVSTSHIARVERGERSPNITIVAKLEKALEGDNR